MILPVVLAAGVAFGFAQSGAAQVTETQARCRTDPITPAAAELRLGLGGAPQLRTQPQPQRIQLQFKRDREPKTERRTIDLVDGLDKMPISFTPRDGDFLIATHSTFVDSVSRSIPQEQIQVLAEIDVPNEQITLVLCLDPLVPEPIDAGTYTGTLSLSDPRFVRVDVPVEVHLQAQQWLLALTFSLVGGSAGGLWGVLSSYISGRQADGHTQPSRNAQEPSGAASSDKRGSSQLKRLILLGLVFGLISGVWTYSDGYERAMGFRGADLGDWLGLAGVAFAAGAVVYTAAVLIEAAWAAMVANRPKGI